MSSRDKEATQKKLLQAVNDLLCEGGDELGVNRIAERAGVDKVLIYRYFGGLPGLLTAFLADGQVWPEFEAIMETAPSVAALMPPEEIAARFVQGFIRDLKHRPATLELIRSELVKSNNITSEVAQLRERHLAELVECHGESERDEVAALYALITAGLMHLMLQSKNTHQFCTLDLHSPDTWARIEAAATKALQSK